MFWALMFLSCLLACFSASFLLLLYIFPKWEGSVKGEGEEGEEDHPCMGHALCQPAGSGTEADSDGSHLPAQNGCHFNRGHQGKQDTNVAFIQFTS